MRGVVGGLVLSFVLVGCTGGESHPPSDAEADYDAGHPRDGGRARWDAGAWRDGSVVTVVDGGVERDGGPVRPTPEHWFDDVTAESGVDLMRVPRDSYETLPDRMSGGVCVLDVDGTAPMDLFFAVRPIEGGVSSRLYVADEPLAYADETEARGLGDVGDAMGCLAFDADGDGDDDLLVTRLGSVGLYRNDAGVFVDVGDRIAATFDPQAMYMGASAGDVDGDGDLDVAVGGFVRFDPARHSADAMCGLIRCTVSLTAYDYAADLLLVRGADGTYRDRAASLASDMTLAEPALVTAVRDLDGDGTPDIYLGNDLGYTYVDRVLRRTDAGTFEDVGEALGLAYNWRGYGIDTMGMSSADLDGDGHLDHVMTSFETDATAVFEWEDGAYVDHARTAGTVALDETFRWGPALVDLDLDGDPDLVEATGHFHSDEEVELIGFHGGVEQRPNLMVNLGDGTLRVVTPSAGDGLSIPHAARGIAVTDLDEDGRPDVVLAPAFGRPALLRNVRPPAGHWLRVRLEGSAPNTGAVGARVTVRSGGRAFVRERVAGEGYLGSFDPRLFFGLPGGGDVEVDVRWPGGGVTTRSDVAVDREIAFTAP